jgi:hypothetical protein
VPPLFVFSLGGNYVRKPAPKLVPSATRVPSKSELSDIRKEAMKRVEETLEHYGASPEHLEDRHIAKFDRILLAQSLEEADSFLKRAEDSVFMTMLKLWGTNKILGPNKAESLEKKAAKADALARWIDKNAQDKHNTPEEVEKALASAEKQRKRAEQLRAEAEKFRNPTPPLEAPCPEPLPGTTVKERKSRTSRKSKESSGTRSTVRSKGRS